MLILLHYILRDLFLFIYYFLIHPFNVSLLEYISLWPILKLFEIT